MVLRHTQYLRLSAHLLLLMLIFTLVVSCSDSENKNRSASGESLKAFSEVTIAANNCKNLIELYRLLDKIKKSDSPITEADDNFIIAKWDNLLLQADASMPLCEEIDIVESTYKKNMQKSGRYTLSMLFRVKENLKKDYLMNVLLYPDKSHLEYLPKSNQKKGYAGWGFEPHPATSKWLDESISIGGKSYLLQNRAVGAADIPYQIKIFFNLTDENGKFSALYGNRVNLGWYADPTR